MVERSDEVVERSDDEVVERSDDEVVERSDDEERREDDVASDAGQVTSLFINAYMLCYRKHHLHCCHPLLSCKHP